jgi:glycosyltransferase involved in cell wall biosynthesis
MASGLPVIATKFGEVAAFVKEANCGILVDPESVEEVASAIEFIFTHEKEAAEMGDRGRQLVKSKYSWEKEKNELVDFYIKLASVKH